MKSVYRKHTDQEYNLFGDKEKIQDQISPGSTKHREKRKNKENDEKISEE